MSLAPTPFAGARAPSPASAHMNFSSNNPFRRAVSPAAVPHHPESTRMSNNPFLDPPAKSVTPSAGASKQDPFGEDIFKDLSLLDKPAPTNAPPRAGTLPNTVHRPSRSNEEEEARRRQLHPRGPPKPRPSPGGLDIFASPGKSETRRPRRNSESSIMDKERTAEDDKRRRERRREREARREKEGRSKDGKSSSSKPTRKPQGLDLIDQLDVTGIYGQGLFHHDGPFDACNPHRNRKKDYRAPMQAFPTGSANNTLGGSGPVNAKIDFDRFHGRGQEGFNDYATSGVVDSSLAKTKPQTFNAAEKVEQIHSEETHGLGTSTFLEGAPASKRALQRRESESDQPTSLPGGGLSRKKSLAVRLRGLSQPRRAGEVTSPEARYGPGSPGSPALMIQSAGGPVKTRYTPGNEKNPFFNEYDDAYEKKGASIRIAEPSGAGRVRAPSSPPRPNGLTRSITTESAGTGGELPERGTGSGGGGFLNRMKSLKGGRRARPERRPS